MHEIPTTTRSREGSDYIGSIVLLILQKDTTNFERKKKHWFLQISLDLADSSWILAYFDLFYV